MINLHDTIKENRKRHNRNCIRFLIIHIPYRLLQIGGFGSGNTNSFFNLINEQIDVDKIGLYNKDPYKADWQFLIKKKRNYRLEPF